MVLLVEDDENDVFLFRRALERTGAPFQLQVARDGGEAQEYLTGGGRFQNRELFPFPKFIITDDRMPVVSGDAFLKWLKNHPHFHVVPTIMLSGSSRPADVTKACDELAVHSYIIKPTGTRELEEALALIFKYWALCAVPPAFQDNAETREPVKPSQGI